MNKTIKTIILSAAAGVCISLGGMVFLSLENKVLGALMFTVGLFVICTRGLNLFTGKVCYALEGNREYNLSLILIWLGNFIGTWLCGIVIRLTRVAGISETAAKICDTKLNDSLLSVFILGIFCNLLIYFAVDGYKNNPHEIGKYLSLFFGVMVFILCGFEHCIANMFYISVAGMWSGRALIFIILNTLGNAVGGLLFPIGKKLMGNKSVNQ